MLNKAWRDKRGYYHQPQIEEWQTVMTNRKQDKKTNSDLQNITQKMAVTKYPVLKWQPIFVILRGYVISSVTDNTFNRTCRRKIYIQPFASTACIWGVLEGSVLLFFFVFCVVVFVLLVFILCVVVFVLLVFILRLVYSILPVSLDSPILDCPSDFL